MTPTTGALKILIADDHPVVREGLVALINRREDMTVVAEAGTGEEAVAQYRAHVPDVALMDLLMPGLDGVGAIAEIRTTHPDARVIVLTTYDGAEDVRRAFQAGAKGYVLKGTPGHELVDAIRSVYQGRTSIAPPLAAKLADAVSATELTVREVEVLRLMADGRGNKDIGAELFVSEGTVKTHVGSILRKLGADDRTQAVTTALKRGILRLS